MAQEGDIRDIMEHALGSDIVLTDIARVWDIVVLYNGFLSTLLHDVIRDQGKLTTVRLLDFDIVYAALWRGLPKDPMPYDRLIGLPQSSYHFFRYNRRPFCFPLGTEVEMAQCISRILQERTSHTGYSLRERLRNVLPCSERARDSGTASEGHPDGAVKAFRAALASSTQNLLSSTRDLSLLNLIASAPMRMDPERLDAEYPLTADHWAILEILRTWLETVRKNRCGANWADAYNLAWYAAIRPRKDSLFPVFASGTKVVLDAPIERYLGIQPSIGRIEDPPVVASRYLTFATAFEQYADYNVQREHTLASAAKAALEPVLDAQNDFRSRGVKPEWYEIDGSLKAIPWGEFASDKHFRRWAREYVRWRASHLQSVLGVFEYYGTSDRQLRNTFLQTRGDSLDEAIHRRTQFNGKVAAEDWLAHGMAVVARVSQQLDQRVRLEDWFGQGTMGVGTREQYRKLLSLKRRDDGSVVIRLRGSAEASPLVACVSRTGSETWHFGWPCRLDLAEVVRFGPCLAEMVCGAYPTTMKYRRSDGTSDEVRVDDSERLRDLAWPTEGFDCDVVFETKGCRLEFAVEVSAFPERQGIQMRLEVAMPRAEVISQIWKLTCRQSVNVQHIEAALSAVLAKKT